MDKSAEQRYSFFRTALLHGNLVLDGGMGTSLAAGASEKSVHRAFLEAGADIIETNTFLSSSLYAPTRENEPDIETRNRESVKLARTEAEKFELSDGRPRFVAGSIACPPVSISADKISPAIYEQTSFLISSGADMIILETICSLPNARAALEGINKARNEYGNIPLIASGFIPENSSFFFCGSTIKDFVALAEEMNVDAAGLNCGTDPDSLGRHLQSISHLTGLPLVFYPGIDVDSPLSPDEFAEKVGKYVHEGRIKIAGGCCGTYPEHIAALIKFIMSR